MTRVRFTHLLLLICFGSVMADGTTLSPSVPPNYESGPPGAELKLLKFFPGKAGMLVGRFKFSNQTSQAIVLHGNPSSMAEIIKLTPTQDNVAYATHVRLNDNKPNKWIWIRGPADAATVKTEKYELYPGEIRYLDISLPNAKDKPNAELLVQLLFQIGEVKYFISSEAFQLPSTN